MTDEPVKSKISFLKKASDLGPKGSLKYLLHSHLTGPEKERSMANVHASSLTKPEGFCPRFYALHDVTNKKPKDQWLTTADVVTYRAGNDIQTQLVEYLADMGRVVGHWVCLACDHNHVFTARPQKCVKCGCKGFRAEEVRIKSAVSDASCGIDILVNLGRQKLVIVETKSMIKDQFMALEAPLAEHRLRTNFYMRLVAESDQPWANLIDTKSAKVLYVCKGGYRADPELKKWGLPDTYSPFKEYDVARDDTKTDDITLRARVVKDFRAGSIPMPCGLCKTAVVDRAMKCSMKAICFSGEHPPIHEWKA